MSRREHNRRALRARVLDAAKDLFGSRGFEAVTMADVAAKAGVARATVFNHFPSKAGLVDAITADVFRYFRLMLEGGLADEETPTPTLVRAFFSHMGHGIEQDQRFYTDAFREVMRLQAGLGDEGEASRERRHALGLVERLLARGLERGELDPALPARDLASAFDSLTFGTIAHWLYDDASGSLAERMQRAAEVFLRPVASEAWREPDTPLPELPPIDLNPSRSEGAPGSNAPISTSGKEP